MFIWMVAHLWLCGVFCIARRPVITKYLIKPFIKLSGTAVLQLDPTTPVSEQLEEL